MFSSFLWSNGRQIGAEHVRYTLPVTIRLLLPDLQKLALIRYRFAAVVLLVEFIVSADVGQVNRSRDFNLCCLPASGKRGRLKHAFPKRADGLFPCQRRDI